MGKVVRLKRVKPQTSRLDPLNVNQRLYQQAHVFLRELEQPDVGEHLTLRERIAVFLAVARMQTIFVGLRKERGGAEQSGSAVRKYEANFKNDTSKRKKIAGPAPADEPDDWFERADLADGDGDDDDTD